MNIYTYRHLHVAHGELVGGAVAALCVVLAKGNFPEGGHEKGHT